MFITGVFERIRVIPQSWGKTHIIRDLMVPSGLQGCRGRCVWEFHVLQDEAIKGVILVYDLPVRARMSS